MLKKIKLPLLFAFIFILFHTFVISFFSFLHLQMDHTISEIENWLSTYIWEIFILSKLSTFSFVLYYFNTVNPYKKKFKKSFFLSIPRSRLVLSVFALIVLSYYFIGQDLLKNDVAKFNLFFIKSYVFCIIYMFIDFYFILELNRIRENKDSFNGLFYHVFFQTLALIVLHPYYIAFKFIFVTHCLFVLLDARIHKINMANIFIYLLFYCAPLFAILGMDPFWGSEHSFFYLTSASLHVGLLCIWGFIMLFSAFGMRRIASVDDFR